MLSLNQFKKILLTTSLVAPVIVLADASWSVADLKTNASKVAVADEGIYRVSNKQFADDISADQDINKLTLDEKQLHEAQVWKLSGTEEKRYVLLMQNKSALYYKDKPLSPVEILGLNARTQQEREKFAKLAAEQNEQKIAQVLTWRTTYTSAYKERTQDLPRIKPFNTDKFNPYGYKAIDLKPGDEVYFYLNLTDPVKAQLSVLYRLIEEAPKTSLHLIFLDKAASVKTINAWAKAHSVPHDLVKAKRLTLQVSSPKVRDQMSDSGKKIPMVVHESRGQTSIVNLSRF